MIKQTDYITKQEYFDFSGVDLDIELKKSNFDNPSKAVEIFIKRIQDWCLDILIHNYFNDDITFDEQAFRKGVLYQIEFNLRNGDVRVDNENKNRFLSPDCEMIWRNAGMCNITPPVYRRLSRYGN